MVTYTNPDLPFGDDMPVYVPLDVALRAERKSAWIGIALGFCGGLGFSLSLFLLLAVVL